jgi:NADH-quinone oxidoreductase subunit A
MLSQYAHILIFIVLSGAFCAAGLVVASLIRFKSGDKVQKIAYECGVEPVGTPYVPTDIRFYLFALLFVVFDVEALFLYPWAVTFRELGLMGFVEMLVFIAVLLLGLIYVWKRGALKWES